MRLGRRRASGGEQRVGRIVNGVQAQVVPKGTIRAILRSHRKEMAGAYVSDAMATELAHRDAEAKVGRAVPGLPERWSLERGRQHLSDLLSGHAPRD